MYLSFSIITVFVVLVLLQWWTILRRDVVWTRTTKYLVSWRLSQFNSKSLFKDGDPKSV